MVSGKRGPVESLPRDIVRELQALGRGRRGSRAVRIRDRVPERAYVCRRCGFMVRLPARWRGVDIPGVVGCLRCDVRLVRRVVREWHLETGSWGECPHGEVARRTGLSWPRLTRALSALTICRSRGTR